MGLSLPLGGSHTPSVTASPCQLPQGGSLWGEPLPPSQREVAGRSPDGGSFRCLRMLGHNSLERGALLPQSASLTAPSKREPWGLPPSLREVAGRSPDGGSLIKTNLPTNTLFHFLVYALTYSTKLRVYFPVGIPQNGHSSFCKFIRSHSIKLHIFFFEML